LGSLIPAYLANAPYRAQETIRHHRNVRDVVANHVPLGRPAVSERGAMRPLRDYMTEIHPATRGNLNSHAARGN